MSYIDKSKPNPDWTPDQRYLYDERLAIKGDGRTDQLRISDYIEAWNEAEKVAIKNPAG